MYLLIIELVACNKIRTAKKSKRNYGYRVSGTRTYWDSNLNISLNESFKFIIIFESCTAMLIYYKIYNFFTTARKIFKNVLISNTFK